MTADALPWERECTVQVGKIYSEGCSVCSFEKKEKCTSTLNPFPNKPWFSRVCCTSLLKTLWEKEKLLVTSNFSFSHSVFYPFTELYATYINFEIVVCNLFEFGRGLSMSFGKGLIIQTCLFM